ncbi:hypothetical protein CLV34_1183 [Luteimicrobium subarcticum]|uniref:Uncharacterized protein n=1 Tax=Luteimicrobium subarcticum TaxID=620910 RepID=A0A2M8WS05_9MICO|nr:hypothetical protein CLV34_1183 [Luteimicrobium subarcticum]
MTANSGTTIRVVSPKGSTSGWTAVDGSAQSSGSVPMTTDHNPAERGVRTLLRLCSACSASAPPAPPLLRLTGHDEAGRGSSPSKAQEGATPLGRRRRADRPTGPRTTPTTTASGPAHRTADHPDDDGERTGPPDRGPPRRRRRADRPTGPRTTPTTTASGPAHRTADHPDDDGERTGVWQPYRRVDDGRACGDALGVDDGRISRTTRTGCAWCTASVSSGPAPLSPVRQATTNEPRPAALRGTCTTRRTRTSWPTADVAVAGAGSSSRPGRNGLDARPKRWTRKPNLVVRRARARARDQPSTRGRARCPLGVVEVDGRWPLAGEHGQAHLASDEGHPATELEHRIGGAGQCSFMRYFPAISRRSGSRSLISWPESAVGSDGLSSRPSSRERIQ